MFWVIIFNHYSYTLTMTIVLKEIPIFLCSRCILSVLLRWANAIKMQINTNTNKTGFFLPTKCLKRVLKYSYLVSIILNYQFPKTMLADFWINFATFLCLSALAHALLALAHLNITEKMHRLLCCMMLFSRVLLKPLYDLFLCSSFTIE